MSEEKLSIIKYDGKQINMYSDERDDYLCITDMAKAHGRRKSIKSWLKNKQTLDFLNVWEKKYNSKYNGAQMGTILKNLKDQNFTFSLKYWIETTNAKGIFTRPGSTGGSYAHKDIAIRFASWLSPEFELYIVEELQRLKKIEEKIQSFELLNEEQILALIRLKEVFKYVAHQTAIEHAHKEVFAANSNSKNPFAEFNAWRNKILDIEKQTIDDRIKQYCLKNGITLTTESKLLKKPKRDQILVLDSYESVRNAVWDFLTMEGEANALNLAKLVEKMVRIEKGEVLRKNESDLFHQKQDLGEFQEFEKLLDEFPKVKTARQLLEARKEYKQLAGYNQMLKGLLAVPPPKKDKK